MPTRVAEIMDTDVPTVRPADDVETVVGVFKEFDLGALPVVNDAGRCVGIITEADLIIPDEQGDLHIPHYIELFGGLVFLEPLRHYEEKLKKAAAATAKDLMTPDPVTIDHDATAREAAHVMSEHHLNRLPVVEHGRYAGLVTRADVLSALAQEG